jgi:hypothetical protein
VYTGWLFGADLNCGANPATPSSAGLTYRDTINCLTTQGATGCPPPPCQGNSMGCAYLPDIRNNNNNSNWVSTIYIRNTSTTQAQNFGIQFYDAFGVPISSTKTLEGFEVPLTVLCQNIPVNGTCEISADEVLLYDQDPNPQNETFIDITWVASAVVTGSLSNNQLSVAVEIQRNDNGQRMNYTGILPADSSAGSPGWEEAGPTLYAPLVKENVNNRRSAIFVMNVGAITTTVNISFYEPGNSVPAIKTVYLAPHARAAVTTVLPCDNCTGSARIVNSNNQPLAAIVLEYNSNDANSSTAHNLFSIGASTIYFPGYNATSTTFAVQNVGNGNATVQMQMYNSFGTPLCSPAPSQTVAQYQQAIFAPCSPSPRAQVVFTSGTPLVGIANEFDDTGDYKGSYSSFLNGANTATVPYFIDNSTWDSGLRIINLSSTSVSYQIHYYPENGTPYSSSWFTLSGNGGVSATTSNFTGSVRVITNNETANIAVFVSVSKTGVSDGRAIYNASGR